MQPSELASDYYLHNFQRLVNSVEQHYLDLLNQNETNWLKAFRQLSPPARMLYVRLLSRKGLYYRKDKLHYPEIGELTQPARELAKAGFIEINNPDWCTEHIAPLFTKPELLTLFPALNKHKSAHKAALLEKLYQLSPKLEEFGQTIFYICHQQNLEIFLLLFFGNSHQDLSQFVLSDLGLHQFESYPVDKETRLFQSREQIENWLVLTSLADDYWNAKEQKNHDAIVNMVRNIPTRVEWPPLERKRQKLINHVARDLERFGMQEEALTLFRQSELPPSRERQIRILDKLGIQDEALTLTLKLKNTPLTEEESEVALTLEKKLSRQLKRPFSPAEKTSFNENHLVLPHTEQRVELAVADYYTEQGWTVFYLENSLICGLFGLAFWDIIFSPIPGAFLNPYQRSPRDMFTPEFRTQRVEMIAERLEHISSGSWCNWLEIYNQKEGLSNDWVNWHSLSKDIIELTVNSIPCSTLSRLFERMLFDPRNNRSGFPDLIMFKNNQYQWVEVKGPGDKLQSNQARWLKMFNQSDIPACIDFITWHKD